MMRPIAVTNSGKRLAGSRRKPVRSTQRVYVGSRPPKINTQRMREHRIKHLPHYQIQRIDRDDLIDIGSEALAWLYDEMVFHFGHRMRRRHMWTKKKFNIRVYQEFEIDYNRYRFITEEVFV